MNGVLSFANCNDAELATRSLAGQRDAFAQIVERYQSLVCSLAYCATGNVSQSEDLAQETFVAVWKGLRALREPEKLRSWLCGIARHIIANALRRQGGEPTHAAEPLETALGLVSPEALPVDRVISREEQAILWRSLECIPETYREPLVLFYREAQSVESVAQALDISEEAVKQRLSRGRKLLQEEVAVFVEGALKQSAPGRAFTLGVLAALPLFTASASAAATGALAAKGSATAKAGTIVGLIGGKLAPILGPLGAFLTLKGFLESARSVRERKFAVKWTCILVAMAMVFAGGIFAIFWFHTSPLLAVVATASFFAVYLGILVNLLIWAGRRRKQIRIAERTSEKRPEARLPYGGPDSKGFKWNVYGGLLGAIFGGPLGWLMILAGQADESITLAVMLAAAVVLFVLGTRAILHKAEQALPVVLAVWGGSCALMLAIVILRWEAWTDLTAWQHSGVFFVIPINLSVFGFLLVAWLVKRRKTKSRIN